MFTGWAGPGYGLGFIPLSASCFELLKCVKWAREVGIAVVERSYLGVVGAHGFVCECVSGSKGGVGGWRNRFWFFS